MVRKDILFLLAVLVVRQTGSFKFEVVSTTEIPSTKNDNENNCQQTCSELKKTNELLTLKLKNAELLNAIKSEKQSENLNKKINDDENVLQEIQEQQNKQKLVENGITLNKDKLVQIENELSNFIKKSSKEIQELKNKQELLQHSTEEVKKQLEHLINQYDNKSKQLNELDIKLQKLEEKLILKATDVEKSNNFKNCKEIQKSGRNVSGVYVIDLPILRNFTVFCDMVTHGGGWTRVLARINGSQNFDLNWADYKKGFGDPSGNFWIGLEPLYQLTNSEDYELLVELVDWDNETNYAQYNKFKIGTEKEGYSLKVLEGYSGDAGDGLSPLIDMKFSTKDMDNDLVVYNNCASSPKGGWWYKDCYLKASKLTGIYSNCTRKTFATTEIHWLPLQKGPSQGAKMMIRPLNN